MNGDCKDCRHYHTCMGGWCELHARRTTPWGTCQKWEQSGRVTGMRTGEVDPVKKGMK